MVDVDIDEAFAAQFDQALKEHGGAIQAALAGLEIEDVPPELHVKWEAMLKGVECLQFIESEIDKWMGPWRARWERVAPREVFPGAIPIQCFRCGWTGPAKDRESHPCKES